MEAVFRNFKNAKARHENAWRNAMDPRNTSTNKMTQYRNASNAYLNAANRLLQYYPIVFSTPYFNTRFRNQNVARRIQTAEKIFRNKRKLLRTELTAIGSLVRAGLPLNVARKVARNY